MNRDPSVDARLASDVTDATSDAQPTLADVLPAAAHLLGVPGFESASFAGSVAEAGSGPVEAVTVLLVDGLGWWPWQANAESTPALSTLTSQRWATTVPSTTPTALASLGTGMLPGAHGIVGAAFRVPEDDSILHPLTWGGDPHPQAIQPEPTVFERVARSGLPVLRIGAQAYATSGITRAVLRGGEYVGAESSEDLVAALGEHRRGLAYAYIADLDRLGHVHGTQSQHWLDCLISIDRMVERILDRMGPNHCLIVTADHGMVDCRPTSRVVMEDLPGAHSIVAIAGEPRLRHVYVAAGQSVTVRDVWRDALGERAWVLTREEFIATGMVGPVEPDYVGRVGDVVLLAREDTVLASAVDTLVSGLVGQHGSVTDAEMHIPVLTGRGRGRG